jgi:hypothetical protein
VNADDVVRALYRHFSGRYAVLTELTTTDHEVAAAWDTFVALGTKEKTRRCDVLLVAPADRIMVEVKVDRGDYLADVRQPRKHTAWQQLSHRWAYAAPAGLIRLDEVPDGWGLLEVGGGVRWARRAPRHRSKDDVLPDLPWTLLLSRLSYAEATLRGHSHGQTGDVEKVRAELQELTRAKDRLLNRASRVERERDYYKRLAVQLGGGWPCSTCGRPVRPKSITNLYGGWVHRKADEAVCEPQRRERLTREAREQWDALTPEKQQGYLWGDRDPARVLASWAHDSGPVPVDPGWGEDEQGAA